MGVLISGQWTHITGVRTVDLPASSPQRVFFICKKATSEGNMGVELPDQCYLITRSRFSPEGTVMQSDAEIRHFSGLTEAKVAADELVMAGHRVDCIMEVDADGPVEWVYRQPAPAAPEPSRVGDANWGSW